MCLSVLLYVRIRVRPSARSGTIWAISAYYVPYIQNMLPLLYSTKVAKDVPYLHNMLPLFYTYLHNILPLSTVVVRSILVRPHTSLEIDLRLFFFH